MNVYVLSSTSIKRFISDEKKNVFNMQMKFILYMHFIDVFLYKAYR